MAIAGPARPVVDGQVESVIRGVGGDVVTLLVLSGVVGRDSGRSRARALGSTGD